MDMLSWSGRRVSARGRQCIHKLAANNPQAEYLSSRVKWLHPLRIREDYRRSLGMEAFLSMDVHRAPGKHASSNAV